MQVNKIMPLLISIIAFALIAGALAITGFNGTSVVKDSVLEFGDDIGKSTLGIDLGLSGGNNDDSRSKFEKSSDTWENITSQDGIGGLENFNWND